jgi:hypothetical protein
MEQFIERYKTGFQLQDWQKTGLLSSLHAEQEPQVVELLEKAMPYVIKHCDTQNSKMILPIIRRIYGELVTGRFANEQNKLLLWLVIDVEDIITNFERIYNKTAKNFKHFKNLDQEASIVELFVSDYTMGINKRLKNYTENELINFLRSISRDKKIEQIL